MTKERQKMLQAIVPQHSRLLQRRKMLRLLLTIILILAPFPFAALHPAIGISDNGDAIFLVIGAVVVLSIAGIIIDQQVKRTRQLPQSLRSDYRQLIILPMLEFIYPGISVSEEAFPFAEIPADGMMAPFTQMIDKPIYKSSEWYTAEHNKKTYSFGHLEIRTITKKDSEKTMHFYSGYIMRFALRRPLEGKVHLWSNRNNKISKKLTALTSGEFNKVALPAPDFEKRFEIWATNQVTARYVVHPAEMQDLLMLQNLVSGRIQLFYSHQSLYLCISERTDMFSLPYNQEVTEEYLANIWRRLSVMKNIISLAEPGTTASFLTHHQVPN